MQCQCDRLSCDRCPDCHTCWACCQCPWFPTGTGTGQLGQQQAEALLRDAVAVAETATQALLRLTRDLSDAWVGLNRRR